MKKQPYHQPLLTRHRLSRMVAAKAANECALLLVCADARAADVELSISKVGTNLVLSWPASATNAVLESSASLTNGWTAVTNAPVTNQQVVSVTVPIQGPQQFFRLKTAEKDPNADKDPGEKDPKADTGKEKESDKDPMTDKDPNQDKVTEGGPT